VRGTPSADFLAGGAAPDRLEGGDGADTIDASGDDADFVDCGAGDDLARADEADRLTGCERVELPAGNGAGATGPAGPAGGGVAPGGAEDGSGGVGAGRFVDRDGDGVLAGPDCDDGRADVHPGARDIPGNGVDEDCKGGDAGRARAGGRLSFEFLAFPDGSTKATKLLVRDLSAGGRAELRCKGPGCRGPAKRTGKRGKGGAVNLRKLIKHRLPGASG
jgi:Putative metal-binding motif/RTX calcium-binding nonapeptide repeat (4 copies)